MLKNIIAAKQKELEHLQCAVPLKYLQIAVQDVPRPISLSAAIKDRPGTAVLAELKRRSPSAGLLKEDYHPAELAQIYENSGAAAISVITERNYFDGDPRHLSQVKEVVRLPLLRKDFLISEYHIYESLLLGADAILLIAAVLSDRELAEYQKLALTLGLECLVEIHNESELARVLSAEILPALIGINNRNLHTFETDLSVTDRLAAIIPEEIILVSASGVKTAADIQDLPARIDAVLIGEALVTASDPGKTLRSFTAEGV